MINSLKARIFPDFNQQLIINTLSDEHRLLYNHLLASIDDKPCSFKEINQEYMKFRAYYMLTINSKSAQNTSINLINNIKSFYALKKKDPDAEFPYKYKSYKYFCPFMYDWNNGNGGFKISDGKLIVNLIGLKDSSKRLILDLPKHVTNTINNGNIKTLTFIKDDLDRYFVIFVNGKPDSNKIINNDFLSIDLGYGDLVTDYCNKSEVKNFSIANMKLKKLQKTSEFLQGKKDLKAKGSKAFKNINKIFRNVKRKQVDKHKDFQHKVSKNIIDLCIKNEIGNLIIGDIKVKKVIRNNTKALKKKIKECTDKDKLIKLQSDLNLEYEKIKINGLSKSTALGRFKTMLEYKAGMAGIEFHSVNEAYTSQQNSLIGEIMFSSKLDNRVVEVKPGVLVDRDLNSAINIAKKVKVVWYDHLLDFNLDKMYMDSHSNLSLC
jgi:transposase